MVTLFLSSRFIFNVIFIAACVAILTGCTRPYVEHTAIEYNKALSNFSQREILLNAVRASKRKALQYTAVSTGTGTLKRDGSLSSNINFTDPVGMAARLSTFSLSPKISASNSSQLTVVNLNSKEFVGSMLDEVDASVFSFFKDNNWTTELLHMMFVHKITTTKMRRWIIHRAAKEICSGSKAPADLCGLTNQDMNRLEFLYNSAKSAGLTQAERICEKKLPRGYKPGSVAEGAESLEVPNFASNECDFLGFRHFIRQLRILGLTFASGTKTVSATPTESEEYVRRVGQTSVDTSVYTEIGRKLNVKKTVKVRTPLVFKLEDVPPKYERFLRATISSAEIVHLRSPQSMIYYLGSIVRAQNNPNEQRRYTPKVVTGIDRSVVPIFEVKKGLSTNAVLSVTDEDGDRYSIPRPDYGSSNEARSLQTLQLVSQVIALQTRREDLPASSTITVAQ